jgi:3-carboxy-cis,cis-muconate cycloisomerase
MLLSMDHLWDMFRSPEVSEAWRDEAFLGSMAAFEAALALAQADAGVVPRQAAQTIAAVCETFCPDSAALAQSARQASTLAIPFVAALTRAVSERDPQAARWVHWGATSQDVVDGATVLCARQALERLQAILLRAGDALAALAHAHADTPMTGRTLLQSAVPVPFGWKAAGWLAQLHRARSALARCAAQTLVLPLGGACGTLASLGEKALPVARALSDRLGLAMPAISWHAARDGFARLGAELAIATGAAAKIGRDVSLMMQPEIGEAFEPDAAGRGGSSAMPHKRNPVGAMLALEAAYRAPSLACTLMAELAVEHERGLGGWQNSAGQLAGLFDAAGSALAAITEVLEGLRIDVARMKENLQATRGLVFAEAVTIRLAEDLGRAQAAAIVERACRRTVDQGAYLREILAQDPEVVAHLDALALDQIFEPGAHFKAARAMIEAVLAQWRQDRSEPDQATGAMR